MTAIPVLSLVPLDARLPREQFIARAVIAEYVAETDDEPWAVVMARRKPQRKRRAAPAPMPAPRRCDDLLDWRPRPRPKRTARMTSLHGSAAPFRSGARPRSLGMKPLSQQERDELAEIERELEPLGDGAYLPVSRAECMGMPRPCPFVSCSHHLKLEGLPDGRLKDNFPHLEVWEMEETCSLDVADRGKHTREDVGKLVNLTFQRIAQLDTVSRENFVAAWKEAADEEN